MTHKFSVGQEVVFTQGASFIIRVPTRCKVTRLLPKEDTQYHIQFGSDSQQRMAPESQLREIPLHRAVHLLDADAVRTVAPYRLGRYRSIPIFWQNEVAR